jgi:8-oxo-dGTP pyrophosphatase MutT (NUDIX family)
MPPKPWTTRESREVYRNKWISVREDLAEMPDGRTTIYGVVTMGRAVGVLPFLPDGRVLMVRQYRYVARENQRWEMPTGGIHPHETPEEGAQRELREEVGYRAGRLTPISTFYSSKSVCDETCYLFLGHDLTPATALPDETEDLEIAALPFDEVLDLVVRSEIRDAMTVIAVLHAARLRAN